MQLSDTGTKNLRVDELNTILEYAVVRIENSKEHFSKRGDRIQNILKNNMFWMTRLDQVKELTQCV